MPNSRLKPLPQSTSNMISVSFNYTFSFPILIRFLVHAGWSSKGNWQYKCSVSHIGEQTAKEPGHEEWAFIGTADYEAWQRGPFPAVMCPFISALWASTEMWRQRVWSKSNSDNWGKGGWKGGREEGRVERGPNRDVCSVSSLYGQEVNWLPLPWQGFVPEGIMVLSQCWTWSRFPC